MCHERWAFHVVIKRKVFLHLYIFIWEIGPRFHVFLANFLLRMRRKGQNYTSDQIFNPKFKMPMGCFLFK